WPDPLVPVEETAEALHRLFERGTIRAIGVSNFSPEQMETFRAVAPLHVVQSPYNLFERAIEKDVLPYARRQGLTVLAYGALCRAARPALAQAPARVGGPSPPRPGPPERAGGRAPPGAAGADGRRARLAPRGGAAGGHRPAPRGVRPGPGGPGLQGAAGAGGG